MLRNMIVGIVAAAAMATAGAAFAQAQFATAAEAKALFDKAVAALKADKAKALADFNKPDGGFRDRDLYVFCAGPDNKFTAHPNPQLVGTPITALVDKTGKKLGDEIMAAAAEGKVAEVNYMFPRPGADTTPVAKVSYVTKVGDQACGVGYYK